MNILLTRSEPGASRMADELLSAGLQPLVAPLLVAESTGTECPRDRYKHVIFVSEHAARFANLARQAVNRTLASMAPLARWYAIGPATEATLRGVLTSERSLSGERYPDIVVPEPARSEGLLDHPNLQSIAGDGVLIVAGEAGRALLPQTLQARGARVASWLVYRRVETAPSADLWARAQEASLLVASSGQGVELLTRHWLRSGLELADRGEQDKIKKRQVPICVPSPRVYNLALKLGWQKPVNCPGASATAVLAGLSQEGLWPPRPKD